MSRIWPEWLPLREDLRSLSPYGAPQVDSQARLNTNENPYPPSPALIEAITRRVEEVSSSLNRYPDRDALQLRIGLAGFLNEGSGQSLKAEQIWAANGSNEIIQSLFLAFGGQKALGFTPSYSMHPLIAKVTGTPWVAGLRRDDFSIDIELACEQIANEEPELIFLTTPNNPTGTSISLLEIKTLAQAAQSVRGLLVIDEAYAEFSTEPSAVTLLASYPNLVVIRTMSKAFAFAGVRLGYLAADPLVVDAMQLVRLPYHLSALTQAVALVALDFRVELLESVQTLIKAREKLVTELKKLGANVIPSSANFLLFTVPSSHEVWQSLFDQGVLVRDVGLAGYLRVTIGTDQENERFLNALSKSLGGSK
ncbi:MAG: histidinol-phosphate transaminase [Candidatus Nanopelagicaceae bacterium]|nr:histidinol-phosphate transaminase [Candidatus Nanopelagicaceae bacterium]